MSKRGKKLRTSPQVRACAAGVTLSAAAIVLIAALGAFLIGKELLPEGSAAAAAPLGVFLAALLGPLPLQRCLGRRPLPVALAYVAGLLLVLLLVRMLLWPEAPFGSWAVPIAAAVGAVLAGLIGGKRPRRRR